MNRLQSIDTLRGVAAFAVAAYHLIGYQFAANPSVFLILPGYGFTGVYLFFVISGFCIHLRYARGKEVDWKAFWKRRIIRLYPAYLASIVLYLLWLQLPINAFFWKDLLLHITMTHNLDNSSVYSINGVWWTLAIEEQLYLLYLALRWMRHNWGWVRTLAICFLARFAWLGLSLALHGTWELPFGEGALTNWWAWALGAVAVEAYIGKIEMPKWCGSIAIGSLLLLAAALIHVQGGRIDVVFGGLLWGTGFFFIVNRVVKSNFSWKPLAGLGLCSYSLYLTHEFVIGTIPAIIVLPACILFAYGFYRLFEKPFMQTIKSPELATATLEHTS
jgi:peptidoglycan/LPS O-acetylase OafA/YrhL